MSTTLALQSMTVREDGRTVVLAFAAAPPPSYTMPDWLLGARAGATIAMSASGGAVTLEPRGGWAQDRDLPIYLDFNDNVASSSNFTNGNYYCAYAIYDSDQSKEIAWSQLTYFTISGSAPQRIPSIEYAGGYLLPPNLSINVYVSQPNGSPTALGLVTALTHTTSTNGNLAVTGPPPGSPAQTFPAPATLRWFQVYKASRPIAAGETVTVTGSAGLIRDSAGNTTAAFSAAAATNSSLVDSTGFLSTALYPDYTIPTGKTLFVAANGNDAYTWAQAANNIAFPVATLDRAISLYQSNVGATGTWGAIRLRHGDVFRPTNQGFPAPNFSGAARTQPFTLGEYWDGSGADPGSRPVLSYDPANAAIVLASNSVAVNHWHLRGIEVLNANGDFPYATYSGFNVNGMLPQDIVVSDCDFGGSSVSVQPLGPSATAHSSSPYGGYIGSGTDLTDVQSFVMHRSIMNQVQSIGLFVRATRHVLISGNTFDRCGDVSPDPALGGPNTEQSTYVQYDNVQGIFVDNFARYAGGDGCQLRCGGVMAGNVFSTNPFAGFVNGVQGTLHNNVVTRPINGITTGPYAAAGGGLTATWTNGSATVTATAGTFTGNVAAGQAILPHSYLGAGLVASIADQTHLTLSENWAGATVGPCPYWVASWTPAAGTVSVANGSPTVAAVSGTTFTADFPADKNHFFSDSSGKPYLVTASSAGSLTISPAYAGSTNVGLSTIQKASFGTYPTVFPYYNARISVTGGSTAVVGTQTSIGGGNFLNNTSFGTLGGIIVGQILRPQVYQSGYKVASVDAGGTFVTLDTPYQGLTQTVPVDVATISVAAAAGSGLQQVNHLGTLADQYGDNLAIGFIEEGTLYVDQDHYTKGFPIQSTNTSYAPAPTTELILRNATFTGTALAWTYTGTWPSPTSTMKVRREHLLFNTAATDGVYVLANPTPPADFGWMASDHNFFDSALVAVGYHGYAESGGGVTGSENYASWVAHTATEAASISGTATYVNSAATLDTYGSSIGHTDEAGLVAFLAGRPLNTWGSTYDVASIVSYFQTAFAPTNLANDGSSPLNYYGAAPYGAATIVYTIGLSPTSGTTLAAFVATANLAGGTFGTTTTIALGVAGGTSTPGSPTISVAAGQTTGNVSITPTGSAGTLLVSSTNNQGMADPISPQSYPVTTATGYTVTGPSTATQFAAAGPYTIALTPGGQNYPAAIHFAPTSTPGRGTPSPASVTVAAGSQSGTYNWTPINSGAATLDATNDAGFAPPAGQSVAVASANRPVATFRIAAGEVVAG